MTSVKTAGDSVQPKLSPGVEKYSIKASRMRKRYAHLVAELLDKGKCGPIRIRAKRPAPKKHTRSRFPSAEAQHHAALAPYKMGDTGLMCGFDHETEQPYYYEVDDISRTLGQRSGVIDTTASNPDWFAPHPSTPYESVSAPPRRADFDLGEDGREAYHAQRAVWYLAHTGSVLEGTIAEQEERYDNACRNFRARAT